MDHGLGFICFCCVSPPASSQQFLPTPSRGFRLLQGDKIDCNPVARPGPLPSTCPVGQYLIQGALPIKDTVKGTGRAGPLPPQPPLRSPLSIFHPLEFYGPNVASSPNSYAPREESPSISSPRDRTDRDALPLFL